MHIYIMYTYVYIVAQSCPTLCNPVDCGPPGSSVHGILQARILQWFAISFSRGSSWPRDRTQVSCIAGRLFNLWATREAPILILRLFIKTNSNSLTFTLATWNWFIHMLNTLYRGKKCAYTYIMYTYYIYNIYIMYNVYIYIWK